MTPTHSDAVDGQPDQPRPESEAPAHPTPESPAPAAPAPAGQAPAPAAQAAASSGSNAPGTPPPAPADGGTDAPLFAHLGLAPAIVKAVKAIGYEAATPIQAATIPILLEGADVLGQAQTGTGKTAAFALPILSRLDLKRHAPQALVLVPTRELAIQVAEAFQKYAAGQAQFQVLPIYGGQSYIPQLAALKRGPQVIVGTPGRIIDHLERGTLNFESIRHVVLDEADEMLAMGFADALHEILSQTPADKQVALFSATMAPNIRQIARKHLRDPREVVIRGQTATAANITQRYWIVSGMHKLDALTRVVETAEFDAMLVFVRTRQAAQELADRLLARGFAATALSGDVPQAQRERTIDKLKNGKLDIVVATDVAARGLDVERITHVVNYDVPYDTESYVHRIGRTGRAGRSGEAILFIAPRERNLLKLIEKATRQKIAPLQLPTVDDVNRRRLARFKAKIGEAIAAGPSEFFRQAVQEVSVETGVDLLTVASAVASMVEASTPVLPTADLAPSPAPRHGDFAAARDGGPTRPAASRRRTQPPPAIAAIDFDDDGDQQTWRLAVGHRHGVLPGNIVGAIAHEAGLDGSQINGVDIQSDYSLVRLPAALPQAVIDHLSQVRVRGQALALRSDRPAQGGQGWRRQEAPAPADFDEGDDGDDDQGDGWADRGDDGPGAVAAAATTASVAADAGAVPVAPGSAEGPAVDPTAGPDEAGAVTAGADNQAQAGHEAGDRPFAPARKPRDAAKAAGARGKPYEARPAGRAPWTKGDSPAPRSERSASKPEWTGPKPAWQKAGAETRPGPRGKAPFKPRGAGPATGGPATKGAYVKKEGFSTKEGSFTKEGYVRKEGYVKKEGFTKKEGYAPRDGQPARAGYAPKGSYPSKGAAPSTGKFAKSTGYAGKGGPKPGPRPAGGKTGFAQKARTGAPATKRAKPARQGG